MTTQRVYAKSMNGKKIIILDANIESLRYRQRCKLMNGLKVKPVKKNQTKVVGPYKYDLKSKL